MLFAIDIDGTIAGRNMRQFAKDCNEAFDLQIDAAILERIRYRSFMAHPAMVAYQQRMGKAAFEAAIEHIEKAAEMLTVKPVLPGAVESVRKLADLGDVGYYTVRKSAIPEQNEAIQQATKCWLNEQYFPNANNVHFCMSVMHKLVALAQYITTTQQRVILIDDLYTLLLQSYAQLERGEHPRIDMAQCQQITETLRAHLTLVAFKADSLPAQRSRLQVTTLPSWEAIDDVIASLERSANTTIVH